MMKGKVDMITDEMKRLQGKITRESIYVRVVDGSARI